MKKINLKTIGNTMFKAYLGLVGVWLVFALSTQLFFIYLQFTGQDERMTNIANKIEWKIDGTFKDNPDNIWYEGPAKK
jgi:hypothetical protein